jgi:hypothetical protein
MDTFFELATHAAPVGIGATAFLDLWALARHRFGRAPLPDYGLVGRWFAYMLRGRFRHQAIAAAPAVAGERLLGWTAHYAIGIAFAAVLLAAFGLEWLERPTLGPALLAGIGTVWAPFLLMQPGMGAGFFASRAPRPGAARVRSLVTHTVFGLALYATGWLLYLYRAVT